MSLYNQTERCANGEGVAQWSLQGEICVLVIHGRCGIRGDVRAHENYWIRTKDRLLNFELW
jgi:hypothetical protein